LKRFRTRLPTPSLPKNRSIASQWPQLFRSRLARAGGFETNTGNNERFAETSAVPGTGISIAGQRNLGNSFIVDGLSARRCGGFGRKFFSEEVIREFQVVRSAVSPNSERASSGIVNVLTNPEPTNWRGKLYGFLRNQRSMPQHLCRNRPKHR